MLVDDQKLDRMVFGSILRKLGIYQVIECGSGEQALSLLKAEPAPDLIILDIRLGDMDGLILCQRIRAMPGLESTPIAMQSSIQDVDTIRRAFEHGAHDYFIKPLRTEEVAIRLRSMLLLRHEMQERARQAQELSALLRRVLPNPIADELERTGEVQSRWCDEAVLMVLDFTGSSRVALEIPIEELIALFNAQFDAFDDISAHYGMTRVKTVGDEYQSVAGLFNDDADVVLRTTAAAFDMRWLVQAWMKKRQQHKLPCWDVHVAIHSGPVAWGIMGNTHFQFDLVGSSVNEVHRICSIAKAGEVCCSSLIQREIDNVTRCQEMGKVHLRNIGDFELFQVLSFNDACHETELDKMLSGHAIWRKQQLPALLQTLFL